MKSGRVCVCEGGGFAALSLKFRGICPLGNFLEDFSSPCPKIPHKGTGQKALVFGNASTLIYYFQVRWVVFASIGYLQIHRSVFCFVLCLQVPYFWTMLNVNVLWNVISDFGPNISRRVQIWSLFRVHWSERRVILNSTWAGFGFELTTYSSTQSRNLGSGTSLLVVTYQHKILEPQSFMILDNTH